MVSHTHTHKLIRFVFGICLILQLTSQMSDVTVTLSTDGLTHRSSLPTSVSHLAIGFLFSSSTTDLRIFQQKIKKGGMDEGRFFRPVNTSLAFTVSFSFVGKYKILFVSCLCSHGALPVGQTVAGFPVNPLYKSPPRSKVKTFLHRRIL